MLKEWPGLYQRPNERPRRCFTDERFELYVWYEPDGGPHHVQLLYLIDSEALRALCWERGQDAAHCDVHGGEGDGLQFDTGRGFAAARSEFDKKAVGRHFREASAALEPGLRKFVLKLIAGYRPSPARGQAPRKKLRVLRGRPDGRAAAADILVVIGALRAFPAAAYAFLGGAREILLASSPRDALKLRRENPGHLLLGDDDGLPIPGFDLQDSPAAASRARLRDRSLILPVPEKTHAALRAAKAERVFAACLPNAAETARSIAIMRKTSVAIAASDAQEDAACADYLEGLLKGTRPSVADIRRRIRGARATKRFFDPETPGLSAADLDMCLRTDFLAFLLEIRRRDGLPFIPRPQP